MKELLDALIGTWRTEGEFLAEDGTVAGHFVGTDAYRRLGAEFVVHEVDVLMGEDPTQAVEVIGPISAVPVASRVFLGDGTVETATVEVTDDGHLSFGAPGARSVLRIAPDGATATGEWRRDGVDGPWMLLRLTRES